jgi:hypothetical protein
MSTPPKAQDDGGSAGGDARSPLEQTVLGVAPPPSGVTTTGTLPPAQLPAAVALAYPAPVTAAPVTAPPVIGTLAEAPPAAEAPAAESEAVIVAAPTIVVAQPAEAAPHADSEAPPTPTVPVVHIGDTLPLDPPAAAERRPEPREPRERSEPKASAAPALDRTALSEDYLRAAREAALSQLAAGAAPISESHDPLPSVAAPAARQPDATLTSIEAPPSAGTRPSSAPPPTGWSALAPERPSPSGVRRFEPVPVVRAPLAESLSGALGPIAELGGHRNFPPPLRPRPLPSRRRDTAGRWLLLASVALATVGVVMLGSRLLNRYRNSTARPEASLATDRLAHMAEVSTGAPSTDASRALMANLPAPQRVSVDARARVVSATGAPGAHGPNEEAPGGAASPESQLAATAGRHVLSGNYAEALPVYRQLERGWPENTAYAAMGRLLEKRLGSTNDTQTITPSSAKP